MAISLAERLADHTQQLILDSAIALLEEEASLEAFTVRGVARRANISERTVFRYFADREAFLDAVAEALGRRLDLPPPPRAMEELLTYPDRLYRRFEANPALVKAGLHTELYPRMRIARSRQRGIAVRKLIDVHAPARSARARKIAAANIHYVLTASTWHYYRFNFGLSLDDTIACAQAMVRQAVGSLAAA